MKGPSSKPRQGVPCIVAQHMDLVNPETMQPVPRDGKTMGEIVMRGNNVMLGHYNDPEATETAFKATLWGMVYSARNFRRPPHRLTEG